MVYYKSFVNNYVDKSPDKRGYVRRNGCYVANLHDFSCLFFMGLEKRIKKLIIGTFYFKILKGEVKEKIWRI